MATSFTNGFMPGQTTNAKLNEVERNIVENRPHLLESYHYVHSQSYVNKMRENNAKVFLDSGAFSAHSLGVNINIFDYCNYIKANKDIIRVEDGDLLASVLDGIGDPLQTYRNQLTMEANGVRPLPCFHFGEDERYLEYYVNNYSYITIGGMVGKPVQTLVKWLDRIWEKYMIDGTGSARLKVHAFGITSVHIMERYPWFSVDSSSWIQYAVFGHIFTENERVIAVSEKSPARQVAGKHLTNYSEIERNKVLQDLEKDGFTLERLASVYESRAVYNSLTFKKINERINKKPIKVFRKQVQELF